jgi:hypothetical protein
MFYKPSLFNYITYDNSDIIIYNSMSGSYGIRKICKEKSKELLKLFKMDKISEDYLDDYKELVDYGYFVLEDFDEKTNRERMLMERIMNSTLRLVIHTTMACNFRCKYCALDFENKYMSKEICDSIIKFIRQNISRYRTVHISWFGGEPLLGINVIQYISEAVIDICKRAKKAYYSSITTNGYLLTPQNVELLLKYKVYDYVVTIDGVKSTHDYQRVLVNGEGTFDQIINNLRYMSSNVKNRNLKVIIRSNITRDIYDVLDEYYDFYNNEFGKDGRFSLFVRPAGDWGGERVKSFVNHLVDESVMDSAIERLSKNVRDIKYLMNFADLDFGGTSCNATYINKYTIGCDGIITKCDTPSEDLSIGRLMDGKMEIDRNKENQWVFGHRHKDSECDNCHFSFSCFGNSCPKSTILYGTKSCAKLNEIDSLLKLYCNTYPNEVAF